MVDKMIMRWSEFFTVFLANDIDKYNQCSYTEIEIQGRLILTEEEIILSNGSKLIAHGKLFTNAQLTIDTKIDDYKIVAKKECFNIKDELQFYKYYLYQNKQVSL